MQAASRAPVHLRIVGTLQLRFGPGAIWTAVASPSAGATPLSRPGQSVPASLMIPEAGGALTDLKGAPIVFRLDPETFGQSCSIAAASRVLHPQLIALTKDG